MKYFVQNPECISSRSHHKIANGYIQVVAGLNETKSDQSEPRRNDVRSESRKSGKHNKACRNLDDPNDVHERRWTHRDKPQNRGAEVLFPVFKQIQEFVQSRNDGNQSI